MNNYITPFKKKYIKLINGKLYLSNPLSNKLKWKRDDIIQLNIFTNLILLHKINTMYCIVCLCKQCEDTLKKAELLNTESTFYTPSFLHIDPVNRLDRLTKIVLLFDKSYVIYIPENILKIFDEQTNFFWCVNNTIIIGD